MDEFDKTLAAGQMLITQFEYVPDGATKFDDEIDMIGSYKDKLREYVTWENKARIIEESASDFIIELRKALELDELIAEISQNMSIGKIYNYNYQFWTINDSVESVMGEGGLLSSKLKEARELKSESSKLFIMKYDAVDSKYSETKYLLRNIDNSDVASHMNIVQDSHQLIALCDDLLDTEIIDYTP